MTQYILTESEYNDYLKLQEKRTNFKNYYREYEKNKYYNVIKVDETKYKEFIKNQNERNKIYKKKALLNLKINNPDEYDKLKEKNRIYKKEWRAKKKEEKQEHKTN